MYHLGHCWASRAVSRGSASALVILIAALQASPAAALPCVYVADVDTVAMIDSTRNTRIDVVPTRNCHEFRAVAVTTDGSRLLVGAYDEMLVVDAATNRVVARVSPLRDFVEDIAVSPDGRYAYVTVRRDTSSLINLTHIAVVDLETGELVRTIEQASHPTFSPDGRWIYAFDEPGLYRRGGLKFIDAASGEVDTTLPGFRGTDLVLAPDGRFLYVFGVTSVPITVVDALQKTVVGTIASYGTEAMAFGSTSDVVYVASQPRRAVLVMKVPEGDVIAEVQLDSYPRRIALTADGSTAYIIQSEVDPAKPAPFSVIDVATNTVTETVRGPVIIGNQIAIGSQGCGLPLCEGDCNADGAVTADELLTGIDLNLRGANCACRAFDLDRTGTVAVDALMRGVNHALDGCVDR